MNVLVTGATGFVGSALLVRLADGAELQVCAHVRSSGRHLSAPVKSVFVAELKPDADWTVALKDMDCVVHTAARVHVMDDVSQDPLAEFRKTNCAATLNLARQAAEAGVKRFIFISSIKVNGEGTLPGKPYTENIEPAPVDPYGVSKREAEDGLRALATETGLQVVIIRPPLIYGAGVKGNLLSLLRWINKGIPLPLGAIHNKRSFVALDNLLDLIAVCLHHPQAANQTFLVADSEDMSTTVLLRGIAKALDKRVFLLPVPEKLLKILLTLLGRGDIGQRLCDSLQLDTSKAKTLLGWIPPVSTDEGLRRLAKGYLDEKTI
ncbi:UDP-glucose 4-epimerase [Crenothrix polyspora]|uniref:UDP-glucose 4-epimerase n=1 Tax=Crenothrix polyspora TaxID=360316 RepID=A0A1R4HB63_9GAMM|nr:SDR family oxidoreductase [Crenothrix polyspora]SJM93110.1 UDP-glucose 4-epimerase [Crenothrix polyspora]